MLSENGSSCGADGAGVGTTEELKASDQMKWVGIMNNVWNSAEEMILKELIYYS